MVMSSLPTEGSVGAEALVVSTSPALQPTQTETLVTAFFSKLKTRTSPARRPSWGHDASDLSFFQRYFTIAIDSDSVKTGEPARRRFSFTSLGFLIVIASLTLITGILIAVIVPLTLKARHDGPDGPPSARVALPIVHPAIMSNFPDPAIWYDNGTWYAFATSNGTGILNEPHSLSGVDLDASNVQLATSDDFVNWDVLGPARDPLPIVGTWAMRGQSARLDLHNKSGPVLGDPRARIWAPAITRRPSDGAYVLYYSAAVMANATKVNAHCVGAAVSMTDSPAGPFRPENITIACPIDQGGAIDPAPFVDSDGTMYLTWKVDGNNIGHGGSCGNTVPPIMPTPIMIQKMHDDGLTPIGTPVMLLDRIASDGPLIEAPDLVRSSDGIYFLFYSSGCTRAPSYDVKYATATNVMGPYTRASNTLLRTGQFGLTAPGSVGVARDASGTHRMAFHARVKLPQGGVRAMFTTTLIFEGHTVQLNATEIHIPP